ncbi:MAG: hypothetical protein JWN54_3903 [Mycobacterium sp.]|nr:hypothetical protein [Mycobacterium sp.]
MSGRTVVAMSVVELAISGGAESGRYEVQVVRSEVGEASASFGVDADKLLGRRGELQQALLASSAATRGPVPLLELPLREVGQELFAALFGGAVAGLYRASLAVAEGQGEPLRVVLRVNAPELAALPWEAMYDPEAGGYVCRREPLVRHVPVASPAAPLQVRPPLRILAVTASPRGLPPLDTGREQAQLTRALAGPTARGSVELRWAREATWDALQELLLTEEWHVVHFIGHGDFDVAADEGVLALVGADGYVNRVEAGRFADLLREARPMPRLVVLNSCASAASGVRNLFSGTAAVLVRSGISAVAAMQFTITDSAAIAFCRGFYTAIAQGRGVDEAVRSGRVAILGTSGRTLEWVTPVLYLRGDDAHLFAVVPAGDRRTHGEGEPRAAERGGAAAGLHDTDELYARAVAASDSGDLASAVPLFDSVLAADPGHPDAAQRRDDAVREQRPADAATGGQPVGTARRVDEAPTAVAPAEEAAAAEPPSPPGPPPTRTLNVGQWVTDVTFSPDGERLATASRKRIRVWALSTGEPLWRRDIGSWADDVAAVAFSPDNSRVGAGSWDGTARVWDAHTGDRQLKIRYSGAVHALAFSPDGARLATGSDDGTAQVWATGTGDRQLEVRHFGFVLAVAFSPDGDRLATGSEDGTARIWDAHTGDRQLQVRHTDTVRAMVFSPDGTRLATGSADGTARIWDAHTGDRLLEVRHTDTVRAVAFSPDGAQLATGSEDKTVRTWTVP